MKVHLEQVELTWVSDWNDWNMSLPVALWHNHEHGKACRNYPLIRKIKLIWPNSRWWLFGRWSIKLTKIFGKNVVINYLLTVFVPLFRENSQCAERHQEWREVLLWMVFLCGKQNNWVHFLSVLQWNACTGVSFTFVSGTKTIWTAWGHFESFILSAQSWPLSAGESWFVRVIQFVVTFAPLVCLSGIEPQGNVVLKPAEFLVETVEAGLGEVLVYVEDPEGHTEEVRTHTLILDFIEHSKVKSSWP